METCLVKVRDDSSDGESRQIESATDGQSRDQVVRRLFERGVFDGNQWFPGTAILKVVFSEEA